MRSFVVRRSKCVCVEGDGTNLKDLTLVAIGDIVVLYAHDLLVREELPPFLWEDLLGPPGPAAGLNVLVPEAFAGQPVWDCVRVGRCVEERKKVDVRVCVHRGGGGQIEQVEVRVSTNGVSSVRLVRFLREG